MTGVQTCALPICSALGRFISADPTLLSANGFNPQTWNRYAYVTNSPLVYADPLGLWRVGYTWTFKKDREGNDTDEVESVQVYLIAEEGDNADTLAAALNISQKDANKLYGKMADGMIRGKEAGGRIGDIFGAIEGKLKEWVQDAIKLGPGEKANWAREQDCSSTASDLSMRESIRSTPQLDDYLRQNAGSLNSEKDLKTGDLVRYAKDGPVAEHFATFLFFDKKGVPWVFSKSGKRGPFEFESAPEIGTKYNYGTIKPLPQAPGKTGYYRRKL